LICPTAIVGHFFSNTKKVF